MNEALVQAAREVRSLAYAPYSSYKVGAAVLGADGNIYTGCNVENASYGLSICAERAALFAMVAAGCTKATACTVVTEDGGTPCGACRQVMLEFCDDPQRFTLHCVGKSTATYALSELLPHGFRLR